MLSSAIVDGFNNAVLSCHSIELVEGDVHYAVLPKLSFMFLIKLFSAVVKLTEGDVIHDTVLAANTLQLDGSHLHLKD